MVPKIAIIGAGPGGCMLARLLQQSQIPVTIFESEPFFNCRSQGGSLDLRSTTGLAAVKTAGLWEEFQTVARYDGESLLVTDKNLTTWVRRRGRKTGTKGTQKLGEAPEIDRADLRRILMESLAEGCVEWGCKLLSIETSPSLSSLSNPELTLHFANGESHSGFDLIVGCDGAFSKTRTDLSDQRPQYTGLGGWAMNIPNAAETAPEVAKLVDRGSVFVYSDGKAFTMQQLTADGGINVGYYGQYTENYVKSCGFDVGNLEEAKKAIRKELQGWREELVGVLEKTRGECVWRNLYELPVGFTWKHKPGITLLGDAAHLMTPFAGIGVNTAFFDALELSYQIIAYTESTREVATLDTHISAYEEAMFIHAHDAQRLTEGSKKDMLFTPGAPRTSIESWVLRHAIADMPGWSHGLVGVVVRTGYWVYKWFV